MTKQLSGGLMSKRKIRIHNIMFQDSSPYQYQEDFEELVLDGPEINAFFITKDNGDKKEGYPALITHLFTFPKPLAGICCKVFRGFVCDEEGCPEWRVSGNFSEKRRGYFSFDEETQQIPTPYLLEVEDEEE